MKKRTLRKRDLQSRYDNFVHPSRLISRSTIQASVVLTIALLVSLVYNHLEVRDIHLDTYAFLQSICGEVDTCHPRVVPWQRSQKAITAIPKGDTILQIPRHLMILDLDALRDDFIREELLSHVKERLAGAAYLAAHLARLQKDPSRLSPILQHYLSILPSLDSFTSYHPILWNESVLQQHLASTATYDHVRSHQAMFRNEYGAFAKASSAFASNVSRTEYYTARLAVLTRAFGTGKLPSNKTLDGVDELDSYNQQYQVDLTQGSYAMVPVLDLYDHHASPNVGFSYQDNAFRISAIRTIPSGGRLWDSYGLRTDSDLFARYGFVNGDGTDYTQASLAQHTLDFAHDLTTSEQRQQRTSVLQYLQYDDGYEKCVTPSDGPAWELQKIKFQYLWNRANVMKHWSIVLAPRRRVPRPPMTDPPVTEPAVPLVNLQQPLVFNGTHVFNTCRVISLTHTDYRGQATQLLHDGLADVTNHTLPPLSTAEDEALEYRTLLCVTRLATMALQRLNARAQVPLTERIAQAPYKSVDWMVSHVLLGEIQTLEALKVLVHSHLRQRFGEVRSTDPGFQMRLHPCPKKNLELLLEMKG